MCKEPDYGRLPEQPRKIPRWLTVLGVFAVLVNLIAGTTGLFDPTPLRLLLTCLNYGGSVLMLGMFYVAYRLGVL